MARDYRWDRHRSLLKPLELSYSLRMVRHLLAGVAFTILGATTAIAATVVPGPVTTPDGSSSANRSHPKYEPSPAAVPGARAEPSVVAPADRVSADMPPTEALFDAINRGDTVAAREAIGRGADIHGRNVLGLTPLEQSVDLGRNDISFLLLSLRGGAGFNTNAGPRDTAQTSVDPASPAATRAQRQADAREAAKARRQQLAEERAARRAPAAPAVSRNARLFAGDGGTPVPQAGFLGFDSAR